MKRKGLRGKTLHYRVEPGDYIPGPGDVIEGIASVSRRPIRLTVYSILEQRTHPDDGATLLTIDGLKRYLDTEDGK